MSYPRTYFRSSFARMAFEKMREDKSDMQQSHDEWYQINLNNLPSKLHPMVVKLDEDEETLNFIQESRELSDQVLTQMMHMFFKFFLTFIMTNTSANGILNRGSMFVFSSAQYQKLLSIPDHVHLDSLLDLGSGDGSVTHRFSHLYKKVYCTEVSSPMRWRLQKLGYEVLEADKWHDNDRLYDTITCLNLLDRCDKPLDVLQKARQHLKKDTGRLVVTLALPFSSYVETGQDQKPQEKMAVEGDTFEAQAHSFLTNVLQPAGFELVALSRVPYLCQGDLQHSYYVLYDSVFVLKAVEESRPVSVSHMGAGDGDNKNDSTDNNE